jgi:hypothetical protein
MGFDEDGEEDVPRRNIIHDDDEDRESHMMEDERDE